MPTRTFHPNPDGDDADDAYGDEGRDHLELIVPLASADGDGDTDPEDDASLEVVLTERGTEWDDDESAPVLATGDNQHERIARFFAGAESGDAEGTRLLDDLDADGTQQFGSTWQALSTGPRRRRAMSISRAAREHAELRLLPVLCVLAVDPDPSVRQYAVQGMSGDDDALPLLIDRLESDSSADVRAAAAEALTPSAELAAGGDDVGMDADDLRDLLETIAADESEPRQLRLRALESVAVFGASGAEGFSSDIADAVTDAYNDGDTSSHAAALIAMGRTLSRQWLPYVQRDLSHDDAEIRLAAVTAAGVVGETSLIEEVATLADDEDDEVRRAAVTALGQIGGTGAVRVLRGLAGQPRDDLDLVDEALQEATLAVDPI